MYCYKDKEIISATSVFNSKLAYGEFILNKTIDMTPKCYLVTGAAGFIGSNIAKSLVNKGHRIIVCDRFRDGIKWKNLQGVLISDIIYPNELIDWLALNEKNIDGIIHMGAISATTERDVDKIVINNFKLSSSLWQAAIKHNIPFIYASSAATYGDGSNGFDDDQSSQALTKLKPLNAYGWSKHLFDRKIIDTIESSRAAPPQWVGLKFFNVYGPNEHHKGEMRSVINKIYPLVAADKNVSLFRSHKAEFTDGGQLRDFIYVNDCVKVIHWLLEHQEVSGIFNVGTGKARKFSDLVIAIGLAINKLPKIDYIDMPIEIRHSYQYFTQANINKLRTKGFKAEFTSLEDGVSDYINNDLSLRLLPHN
jgi:ADP-L-glycero-D-manno-heptose 6-epimerase